MMSLLVKLVRENQGYECVELAKLLQTNNSTLFVITFRDTRKKQLLKICKAPISAKLQYQSLVNLYKSMGSGALSVPEPGIYIEEQSAYSMEWLEGLSVREYVSSFCRSNRDCMSVVENCGSWLKFFHSIGLDGKPQPPSLQSKLEYLHAAVESQSRHSVIDKLILEWLWLKRPVAEDESLPWGKLHGDFTADNLILSDAKLFGIDIEIYSSGTQIMDAVQFLSNLELLTAENIFFYWKNRKRQLDKAFLQAYHPNGGLEDSIVFRWLRIFHLLHLRQLALKGNTPHARWRSYILGRRLSQLLL